MLCANSSPLPCLALICSLCLVFCLLPQLLQVALKAAVRSYRAFFWGCTLSERGADSVWGDFVTPEKVSVQNSKLVILSFYSTVLCPKYIYCRVVLVSGLPCKQHRERSPQIFGALSFTEGHACLNFYKERQGKTKWPEICRAGNCPGLIGKQSLSFSLTSKVISV